MPQTVTTFRAKFAMHSYKVKCALAEILLSCTRMYFILTPNCSTSRCRLRSRMMWGRKMPWSLKTWEESYCLMSIKQSPRNFECMPWHWQTSRIGSAYLQHRRWAQAHLRFQWWLKIALSLWQSWLPANHKAMRLWMKIFQPRSRLISLIRVCWWDCKSSLCMTLKLYNINLQ